MTVAEILTELVGFFAYESGATDSGVCDNARRSELRDSYFNLVTEPSSRVDEAKWYRDYWLSNKAIAQGYGAEDVYLFMKWLENDL